LRTLVNLRWLAVIGQTITVGVASLALSFVLPVWACLAAILALAITNTIAQITYPATYRLTEREALGVLVFDLIQLCVLLLLTGGLHNPFAMLILGPVTLAATTLSLRSTMFVGAAALFMITLLAEYHIPLVTQDGETIALPWLQLLGRWVAIVIATLLFGAFALRMTLESARLSRALLATQTALSREQKLHDLGGVVAAAAHELGTPLATIKLVSSELEETLETTDDARADLALIRSQADRCRDILRSMGRAGKDDLHLRAAPLEAVVSEAAEPHAERGAAILYDFAAEAGPPSERPAIRRSPELIHGLRNLIQNAVDFAEETISVEGRWSAQEIRIRIEDDGPGYKPEMLERLGDPFVRSRAGRQNYEGMGLGLFISKTLLERTGARITFANRRSFGSRRGAVVELIWSRSELEATDAAGLGENPVL
jgi:two-component system sensor histidine kinase RegB